MKKNLPYILIALGVATVVSILAFFDLYDSFEHRLLDMRFKSRGLVEIRDDIATVDIDTDALATIGILDGAGDVKTDTIYNGASNVTTDLTSVTDWTDGDVKGFKVLVSAAGVVTYEISDNGDSAGTSGATYGSSAQAVAYTFTDGLNVVPYWYHIHAAASSADIIWRSFEFGLQ